MISKLSLSIWCRSSESWSFNCFLGFVPLILVPQRNIIHRNIQESDPRVSGWSNDICVPLLHVGLNYRHAMLIRYSPLFVLTSKRTCGKPNVQEIQFHPSFSLNHSTRSQFFDPCSIHYCIQLWREVVCSLRYVPFPSLKITGFRT